MLRYVHFTVEGATERVVAVLVWNAADLKGAQPYVSRMVNEMKKLGAGYFKGGGKEARGGRKKEDGGGDGDDVVDDDNDDDERTSLWHSIWVHCHDDEGNSIYNRKEGSGRWFLVHGPRFSREDVFPPVAALLGPSSRSSSSSSSSRGSSPACLYFTPQVFRQANFGAFSAQVGVDVLDAVRESGADTVLELYGGTGALSLNLWAMDKLSPVEKRLRWIKCSEINPAAEECFAKGMGAMKKATAGKGPFSSRCDVSFHACSAEDALLEENLGDGAAAIIVDPPRAGLSDEVARWLATPKKGSSYVDLPDVLIYCSCNFASLARDLDVLLGDKKGCWKIRRATGYLLFPGADHIETVVTMVRS